MKKYFTALSILLFVSVAAHAKQIKVSVLGMSFSPSSFTAAIGDTIRFVWGGVGLHTTTSTSVPSGAKTWNVPIDNTHTTFLYPVKVAGSYAYRCNFHYFMGMVGSFKASYLAKIVVTKAVVVNNCTNTNSLTYKCTLSKPPYKVQLYRYGLAYGTLRTVLDTLPFTYSSLPIGSFYATARGNNGTDLLTGKSATSVMVPVPTGLFATHITGTKATLKWKKYTCVKFYSVQYRKKGTTTWIKVNTVGNKDSLNLTSLTIKTKYQFQVAAVDSARKIIATGRYSVIDSFVTASSGLVLTDAYITDCFTGEPLNNSDAFITVFPNPARSYFTIQSNDLQYNAAVLRNSEGRIVWQQSQTNLLMKGKSFQINASLFPGGIYFLQLADIENHIATKKIIVIR